MIINLTQHLATAEQISAGVVDMAPEARTRLQALLTFKTRPSPMAVNERALEIVQLLLDTHPEAKQVMLGCAPYLVARLERAIEEVGIKALYSFTERASSETTLPCGKVRKVGEFFHLGFVPA